MKHAWVVYLSIALVLVLLFGAWVRADADGRMRGEFAEKLTADNDEEIAFYASGLFGKRLMIVPEYADHEPGGQVDCDAIVDWLVIDKKEMSDIHAKGFTSIHCGARAVSSWQAKF
jgi:hypothetical protein